MVMNFYSEIKRNLIKTFFLSFVFMVILLSVGIILDLTFEIFPVSTVIFLAIASLQLLIAILAGHKLILRSMKARPVNADNIEEKQLMNILEELAIANGMPKTPGLYVIEDDRVINAFATGYSGKNGIICVTTGLMKILNREEMQGVIAHELGHILNRDVALMTVLTALLGSLVLLQGIMGRSLWYSALFGSSRRYRSSRSGRGGGNQAVILYMALFFILSILAGIMARLLLLGISRTREYLADASAVEMVRNSNGLAGALKKIGRAHYPLKSANLATAHLFIADPLCRAVNEREGFWANLASTHPPLHKRIARLENKEPAEVLSSLY